MSDTNLVFQLQGRVGVSMVTGSLPCEDAAAYSGVGWSHWVATRE